jgi:hypothetical protein
LLKEFETSIEEIEAELARCLPVLESLKRKVGRHERTSISEVVQLISANKTLSAGSKNAVRDIYKELTQGGRGYEESAQRQTMGALGL